MFPFGSQFSGLVASLSIIALRHMPPEDRQCKRSGRTCLTSLARYVTTGGYKTSLIRNSEQSDENQSFPRGCHAAFDAL